MHVSFYPLFLVTFHFVTDVKDPLKVYSKTYNYLYFVKFVPNLVFLLHLLHCYTFLKLPLLLIVIYYTTIIHLFLFLTTSEWSAII